MYPSLFYSVLVFPPCWLPALYWFWSFVCRLYCPVIHFVLVGSFLLSLCSCLCFRTGDLALKSKPVFLSLPFSLCSCPYTSKPVFVPVLSPLSCHVSNPVSHALHSALVNKVYFMFSFCHFVCILGPSSRILCPGINIQAEHSMYCTVWPSTANDIQEFNIVVYDPTQVLSSLFVSPYNESCTSSLYLHSW